ncbi:ranBP2-like and GRIP domain-containing protein 3 isoform X1 [Anoplophora glabripennis]|uniref:ranBP2-like and GRIP domain-containing protein 3 isoform X1 n=1 Tax=Anoplophora glabripennis TaxID=217634 RepID=UPI000C77E3CF|nr:ranBP2-like and GRIP domain-containing protein 3 isoform X1 [Anoplophora glabripennis]
MFKTKLELDIHVDNSLKRINNETERDLSCFSFAKLYFNVGDYEQTCRYVSLYLTGKSKSAEGYELLGKALEKLSKKEAALEAYRTSLQLDPNQDNLVIKACELLASDNVDMDHPDAKYFYNLGQSVNPQDPAVFSLRVRLIFSKNDDPIEVSKLLLKELETRPTDVNLRVRLLKHFLQNNLIKEAYKHASAIEEKNLSIFHNDLTWYETFAEVLVRFESDLICSSQLTWEVWFLSVSVQDRLVALSLDEHLDTVKTSTEYVTAVFNFDQMLYKASQNIQTCPDDELVTVFLSHYHAQLYFYLATLIFKQAKKDLIQFKEASNVTLPVLLAAYHSSPPDLQSIRQAESPESRRRLVQHWHKEASYRCSQTGHILLAAAKDRKTIVLEKATQYSTGMWREQLYKKVFVKRDQQLKISTSFFVSSFQVLEPVIKLPDPLDLVKFDEVAQLVYPDSLHHYIWLGLNSKLSDMEVKSFEGLQYSIKNLNNCAAEELNVLDIQSFLYCAILCAKSKMEDTKNLIYYNHDRPTVLPVCVTDHLGTLNQWMFVSAAYNMYKNEPGANMASIHLLLIRGIKMVRCIDCHGLDVRVLVTLAKIFEERSKKLTKQSEIEFNDARAEMYWKTALPFLEKVKNNQMITYSNNRLFEYKGKDISISEASSYIESGKLFTAIQLMKKKEYEKALHIFEQLKDPYASFYQSEIYKHMADQKTNQNKENVTSEMRSQNIILLSRARDCLYLTLDRLREPSVDRTHPLNSQLGTEIEKIERLMSRIDSNCTNCNERDGMAEENSSSDNKENSSSDNKENSSSDNSAGDHYLTTYTTHTSFYDVPYTPKHDPISSISRKEISQMLDEKLAAANASMDSVLNQILSVQKNLVEDMQIVKNEINELKTHRKNILLSDEDLLFDSNINFNIGAYNMNSPSVSSNNEPGRIRNASNLAAAYGGLGLPPQSDALPFVPDQQLPSTSASVAASYAQPILGRPFLTQGLPSSFQKKDENILEDMQVVKKEISELKTHTKNNLLSDEDPNVLDPDCGVDYNINSNIGAYNTNLPSVCPNYQPGKIGNASNLAAAYGGLGLPPQSDALPFVPDQQLPSTSASVAASYAQPILGRPFLTQGLPSTSLGIGMLTEHTVPHITQLIKESSKAVPVSTTQSLFPSSHSSSTTATINKAAPVNVVITNSNPLPTTSTLTSQPVLSVTIPPQHIKSNIAKSQPHNYQIPLPSTAVTAIASTPSVLSKSPPAISTQSLLSNVSPLVFSAVAQTKSPSNVSLGLQFDQTFNPEKNSTFIDNRVEQAAFKTSEKDEKFHESFEPRKKSYQDRAKKSSHPAIKKSTKKKSATSEHEGVRSRPHTRSQGHTENASNDDISSASVSASNPDSSTEALVSLPDAIVVPRENVLFKQKSVRLHKHDTNSSTWKFKGTGSLKVLHQSQNNTYRIFMRYRKDVLNQRIVPNLDLQPIHRSNTPYVEFNILSEDENNLEKLQVGFKLVKLAKQFHDVAQDVIKEVTEVQNKSLPATAQNFDEDDKDKDEDGDKDERSVLFTKCCTLSELSLCRMWKPITMGKLQIYYDPEMKARLMLNDDSGNVLSNTLIGMNTLMEIEKTECTWRAEEGADGDMNWRTLKATFSSEVTAKEFYSNYLKVLSQQK